MEQDGEEPSQHIPLSEFRGVSGNMVRLCVVEHCLIIALKTLVCT